MRDPSGRLEGSKDAAMTGALGLAFGRASGLMQAHAEAKPSLALQTRPAARERVDVRPGALGTATDRRSLRSIRRWSGRSGRRNAAPMLKGETLG